MKAWISAFVLGFLACRAMAAPSAFDYGLKLFEEGDYYRSITELDRFRFFSPKDKNSEAALWLIADAYFRGEKWDLAQKSYEDFLEAYPSSPRAIEASFFRAESAYEARNLGLARDAYLKLLGQSSPPALALSARLRLASLSLIDGKWLEAKSRFEDAAKEDPQRLDSYQRWEKLTNEGMALRPYSVSLAVLSSAVIPGSGQMECGYWSDGLSALTLVGGLAAWSAYFYATHQQLSGTVFGVVGGVFYLGNLQGAVLAAKRGNRERPRTLIKEILEEIGSRPSPSPSLEPWVQPGH
jgi:tetratricopeptide (TPR) repeat protein